MPPWGPALTSAPRTLLPRLGEGGGGRYGQPLTCRGAAVAGGAGDAGTDAVADPRNGGGGLGDVGGEPHPPAGVGLKDPVLLGGGEPGGEGQDLGVAPGEGSEGIG